MKKYTISTITALTVVCAFGLVGMTSVFAATTPSLGTAGTYGVLSSTFTANGASTAIIGDLGKTTVSGTYTVSGTTNTPAPAQSDTDAGAALTNLNSQSCTSLGTNVVLSGTYTPGCYSSTGTMDIVLGTTVTLNGTGTYIFRSGGAITTGANSIVKLTNGASSCDVFWTPNGATTLGANSTFVGTDLPVAQDITIGSTVSWKGRALTYGHEVTANGADSIDATCSVGAVVSGSTGYGTINVVKLVINDNGGTKKVADFPLFVNGTLVVSGDTNSFLAPASAYAITETTNPAYKQTFSGDCDENGYVGLIPGDNRFCIITNNDIGAPTVVPPVPPLMAMVKTANPLSLPAGPGSVEYTYTLRNIGTVPVTDITIVGDTCKPIILVSGDTNNNKKLDLNETWVHHCTTNLLGTHTNIAVATGWANGISTTDIASATVVVGLPIVPPLIHITKVPSPFSLPAGGGIVTYTKTVTNPGTVALDNIRLTDDKCSPVRFISGDVNGDNKLNPTEKWVYTCRTNLTETTINTVTASGDANGLTARDIAVATVVVASIASGLPNTGFAPIGGVFAWFAVIAGIVLVAGLAYYFLKRKQIIS
jgi:uncharacterized repeat protein (TIGR01451 family)